jgi:hypothetical protein
MVAATGGGRGRPTSRIDRAMHGAIATYVHELTEHGRPREGAGDAFAQTPGPRPAASAGADAAPVSGDGLDLV